MMSRLKPSVVSDTVSAHKLFNAARLKLTGVSVLVVALIILAFSYYIYQNITSDVVDIGSRVTAVDGDNVQQQFVDPTNASVVNALIYADIGTLILAAILSFYFAGRTLRPIQKANAAQRAFAANASHELRTPLAILKSDTEILSRATHPSNELVHEIAASNLEEVERMERIVKDLLSLARSERTVSNAKDRMDIAGMARHVVNKLGRIAQERDIHLTYQGVPSLYVRGGAGFDRVFMNIVQNSLDHTGKGGSITVSVREEKTGAHAAVADTGSGIDVKDLPHVFEPFYKDAAGRGSGLGLSLVKEIVERHGGTISIASEHGEGTIVNLHLPHPV